MAITSIAVSNFKSFKHLDLNLGPFNVVIGANAAGKSNFTEVFKLLRDIEVNKLDDAIFMHGGSTSMLNRRIGVTESLRITAISDKEMGWGLRSQFVRIFRSTYDISLRFGGETRGVKVEIDSLQQDFETGTLKEEQGRLFEDEISAKGKLSVCIVDGKPDIRIDPIELGKALESAQVLPPLSLVSEFRSQDTGKSMLALHARRSLLTPWESLFGDISFFNIDPHIAKGPCPISGKPELQENGGNLALILRQILSDSEKSRKFHNLLQDLLPFAVEVGIEKYPEKSILLNLKESYYPEAFLAHLLSDGTLNVAALVVALYFEDSDLVIIEEPERNIHPRLISGLVEMMKDASRNKQVIITTHSPEVVRHAGLENLLLISRDKDGFSTVSRPAEKEEVRVFLENNLGLDEMFVQDLLAV